MNKKEFYKAQGKLESGKELDQETVIDLMAFTETLLCVIEEAEDNNGDVFGTEGFEHAIGWD